jgi:hypothetical protein
VDRRLGGPQSRSGRCGEEKNLAGNRWSILQQWALDCIFIAEVLLTDKSCFTKTGITYVHKENARSDKSHHAIQSVTKVLPHFIGKTWWPQLP